MTVLTTRIVVAADGSVSLAPPLPVGEHVASVELSGSRPVQEPVEPFDIDSWPVLDTVSWPWPEGTTFSREEIYGDDGR